MKFLGLHGIPAVFFHIMKVQFAFMDRGTVIKEPVPGGAAKAAAERGMWMAEYKQMSIYFDLEKPDEAWVYQYLMSLRHGKKAVIITALKMMLGKGEQMVPFSAQSMQLPGNSGKKKNADRQAFGQVAAKRDADVGDVMSGVGEKPGGILTEGKSRGLSDREPVESALPDAIPSPAGKDISVQEDGKEDSDWRTFFTQEQLAAILEKNLDMSQLTEDGIRQMVGQVQNGIPVKAAYREALMWCQ